jgi:hypothetical protein
MAINPQIEQYRDNVHPILRSCYDEGKRRAENALP